MSCSHFQQAGGMKSKGNFPRPFEFYMAAQHFFGPGHLQSQPLLSRYFCFLFEPFFHFFVFYLDIKFIVHLMHYSINIVVIIIIIILIVCFVFKNLLWYCQEFCLFVPSSPLPPKKGFFCATCNILHPGIPFWSTQTNN